MKRLEKGIIDVGNGMFKSKDKNAQNAWSGYNQIHLTPKNSLLELTGDEKGERDIGNLDRVKI